VSDVAARPFAEGPLGSQPAALGAGGAEVNWTRVYLGFAGMIIGQFMATIDIQIVASSLTQIQSGISASADEIAWVQTIYLLAEVVVMPLTAYLTKMWGTRVFYVIAVVGFIVTSALVGLSSSVLTMIVFRALQGLFAGAMIPPVFATAMTIFPPEKRLMANVFVGLIVTLSGTIGPTLGGHITDLLNWRWLFFINIPVGVLVIFLVGRYANFDRGDPSLSNGIDWLGLALMAVFLLSVQYVLEEGPGDRWFDDPVILWLSVTGALAGAAFAWRQLTYWQPIVSLKPFADPNFTLGAIMTFITGIGMYGGTFLMPIYLGRVRGFSSGEVGTTMLVTGLSMFLAAPLVGRLVGRMDARLALVGGFALTGWAMHLAVHITDQWGFAEFFVLQAVRGASMMLAMVAAQQLSVATLPVHLMKDASGLVNLTRNVAGALGLAMLTTILGHQSAEHFMDLASAANMANANSSGMLAGLTEMLSAGGMAEPEAAARKAMNGLLRRQAMVLSFGDAFAALAISCWIAAFLGLFARPGSAMARADSPGGH
jgi:MFS transporter, DHA2 family, multidrug resistance protein